MGHAWLACSYRDWRNILIPIGRLFPGDIRRRLKVLGPRRTTGKRAYVIRAWQHHIVVDLLRLHNRDSETTSRWASRLSKISKPRIGGKRPGHGTR